jgi:hypothetical protein
MAEPLDTIQKEWSVIRTAPWSIAAVTFVVIAAVWFLISQINSATFAAKDATIETFRAQNQSYKEKLNGASPEEASARIKLLEERLSKVEGRNIDPNKLSAARETLSKLAGGPYYLSVASDMVCADCSSYSDQIVSIFSQPPWSIRTPIVGGPTGKSPKGLSVLIPDPKNIPKEVTVIIDAFKAAGFAFDVKSGGDAFVDPFGKVDYSKRIPEILISTRSM